MNIEIQTYWNVETLYYVLNAVASVMTSGGWPSDQVRLPRCVAHRDVRVHGAPRRHGDVVHSGVRVCHDSQYADRASDALRSHGPPAPRQVDHVPVALAAIAQASSLSFGFLTRAYETAFNVPDDLGLAKGDVGFGHRILRQVNSAVVRDPALRADLMQFFKECTKYDILTGRSRPARSSVRRTRGTRSSAIPALPASLHTTC